MQGRGGKQFPETANCGQGGKLRHGLGSVQGRFRVGRVQDCNFRRDPDQAVLRPGSYSKQAGAGVASTGHEDNFGAFAGRVQHIPVGLGPRRAEGTQHSHERGHKGSTFGRIHAVDANDNGFHRVAGVSAVDHPAAPGTRTRD
ncbi:hypothetical protein [Arthrobacter sp. H41]|uniref:hypothetical protein n=1 Tax=Arthrobacter sp. H41 TaxID=1312978 RepID=UPI000676736E|nr:hypothetical protein [Arthrobacter sp. H41]